MKSRIPRVGVVRSYAQDTESGRRPSRFFHAEAARCDSERLPRWLYVHCRLACSEQYAFSLHFASKMSASTSLDSCKIVMLARRGENELKQHVHFGSKFWRTCNSTPFPILFVFLALIQYKECIM
jgi:hypothetical protein